RQKRMIIDGQDFHLDLLFYSRSLRRLIAIELKLGRFQAKHKGQMELYLKWLDRYERKEGELKNINRVHPYFSENDWKDLKHFTLLFHDQIFEIVAKDFRIETSGRPLANWQQKWRDG